MKGLGDYTIPAINGELFITSRQDGVIRMLVPDSGGATPPPR